MLPSVIQRCFWSQPQADAGCCEYPLIRETGRLNSVQDTWRKISSKDTLPADMLEEECSVVVCFKLSVLINTSLHGEPGMTFSARTYREKIEAQRLCRWLVWSIICSLIDLACACTRAEAHHCETAYVNYTRR